jgi:radical SAM protein with 4Fe4S-binding SPASM domain
MNNIGIKLSAPTSVELTLTQACNHKCLHCYNPYRKRACSKTSGFTKEQLAIIINELEKNNVWHVTMSGGEPLVRTDVMFETAKLLQNSKITFSMNTNLSLMTNEIADFMQEQLNWDTLILTSLPSVHKELCDKITQTQGSYDNILRGIKICKQHGFKVGINIVISKMNISDLSTIDNFIRENPIDYLCISIVIPPTYDSQNKDYYLSNDDVIQIADALIDINKKYNIDVDSITPLPLCIIKNIDKYINIISTTCSAGLTRCTIDTDGNIFACSHEEKPYGNIFTDGLKSSWNRMDNWRAVETLNPECKECKYLSLCGGECRMMHNIDNKYYQLSNCADIQFTPDEDNMNINHQTTFTVQNDIQIRKEEFGAAIRIKYSEYFITQPVLDFYYILKDIQTFSIADILEFVEENENFYEVLYQLETLGIISRD